jgi:hypothetical protein
MRALGHRINRKRVERLMREMGLQAKQRLKFHPLCPLTEFPDLNPQE